MLAVLLLTQALAPMAPQEEPVTLFRAVCMNGGATLSGNSASEVSAAALPAAVRTILGRNLIDPRLLASFGFNATISAGETLPNKIYRLRGDAEEYLILPTGGDIKGNAFAGFCAVVVKGDQYLAALGDVSPKEAARFSKERARHRSGPSELPYFRGRSGKNELSVTEWNGWTSMATISTRTK